MAPTQRGVPDDVSKAIIEQLQEDGRRAYATIGKAVGLSEAAVRQRVQKLVDSGVMQIVAVTDPMQIGFARQAMIAISVSGDIEAVADAARRDRRGRLHRHHRRVVRPAWPRSSSRTTSTCSHSSTAASGPSPASPRTETFLYLKLVKQTYNWGAR